MVLHFWCRLTQVVPEKRLLNGHSSIYTLQVTGKKKAQEKVEQWLQSDDVVQPITASLLVSASDVHQQPSTDLMVSDSDVCQPTSTDLLVSAGDVVQREKEMFVPRYRKRDPDQWKRNKPK